MNRHWKSPKVSQRRDNGMMAVHQWSRPEAQCGGPEHSACDVVLRDLSADPVSNCADDSGIQICAELPVLWKSMSVNVVRCVQSCGAHLRMFGHHGKSMVLLLSYLAYWHLRLSFIGFLCTAIV